MIFIGEKSTVAERTEISHPQLHQKPNPGSEAMKSSDVDQWIGALRFIRDRAHEKIDACDVVRHAGLSRSSIETRFRKTLGRSVKDEISRAGIDRSLVLLREPPLTLQQIAEACGFATASHFSRLFKESQEMTAGACRDGKSGK